MKRSRLVILPAALLGGCCMPGSDCCSGWYGLELRGALLELVELDGASGVVLEVELSAEYGSFHDSAALLLVPNEDGRWSLPEGAELFRTTGCPFQGEISFALVHDAPADSADPQLESIVAEVYADMGNDQVVALWGAWMLSLSWGGWTV